MTFIILSISILILALLIYLIFSLKSSGTEEFSKKLEEALEKAQERNLEEFSRNRSEYSAAARDLRQELTGTITKLSENNALQQKNQLETFALTLKNISEVQIKNLEALNDSLKNLNNSTKDTLTKEIRFLQEQNDKKLEEMRHTVDEKLQTTLEKRLGESFKIVSDQLDRVYKGLGEMQTLASDVGDLKKVLTNVKSRGVFGELQLKNLLEDILTQEQYVENANIKKNSRESVEFAIKLPSKDEEGRHVLLPVDSKFPREDYEAILNAQEEADPEALATASKNLAQRITGEAKDISEKYIDPPATTDFALMFLPAEGLFAEVLRIPGLFEKIRKDYNVVITGPTTITAILNSLQMGFRTLAIEKRSSEVWKVLGAVKTEFGKFSDYLSKTREKLQQAADNIKKAEKRTQMIGKKLKGVEHLGDIETENLLGLSEETVSGTEETEIEEK